MFRIPRYESPMLATPEIPTFLDRRELLHRAAAADHLAANADRPFTVGYDSSVISRGSEYFYNDPPRPDDAVHAACPL
jgi:hypothetical protein